ncbi:MAG TPA: hypothetical protein VL049_23825 [Candidatus Dormibacteraeota bacterium]|nr:hypothetical protein [Candidatus Dormibacteraeota bacterium]
MPALFLLAFLAACAARRPVPPPPLAAVTVLPVADVPERAATTGIFTFYSWIADLRAAVPDQLAAALRDHLATRGITALAAHGPAPPTLPQAIQAVSAAHLENPALYVVLGKWEAENVTSPQYVDVSLDATLIAPSGKILWTSRRESGPVATLNAIDLASAYRMAIGDVAERLVGNWSAERSTTKD